MNHYYKVIADNSVAGVCTEYDFRRYQAKHNIIIVSDCDRVECVQIGTGTTMMNGWLTASART